MSNISNKQLCTSAQNAYNNNSLSEFVDTYRAWQVSRCTHPKLIWITDGHTGERRQIEVPCGTCYHCRESKQNEWVTRMYAHLEDFANAYFITLTYRPVSFKYTDVERLYMNKMQDALFHLDNYNINKSLSYNPCVLVKKHYQDFIKRLRKNTGISDLTYCLCGEYGKTYGRPHYHAILFTNSTLTHHDIRRAWSIALWRDSSGRFSYRTNQKKNGTPYNMLIGRTDFHDLVINGTINKGQKIKIDNNYMSAANCFAYVCKYICKQDNYNKFRARLAYNNLYRSLRMVDFGHFHILYDGIEEFLQKQGFKITSEHLKQLKSKSYEKVFDKTDGNFCLTDKFQRRKIIDLPNAQIIVEIYPTNYYQFIAKFAPFVEYSRGTPLGCLYASTHIQEFTQGVFNRPLLQDKGFVVPSYFFHKAQDYIYGLRSVRKGLSGVSYNLGNLPHFERFLLSLRDSVPSNYKCVSNYLFFGDVAKIIHSDLSFFDTYTKEHVILPYNPATCELSVEYYKYDRSRRVFVLTRSCDIRSFVDEWLARLSSEQVRYKLAATKSRQNYLFKMRAFDIAQELGFDLTSNQLREDEQAAHFLRLQQRDYDATHVCIE